MTNNGHGTSGTSRFRKGQVAEQKTIGAGIGGASSGTAMVAIANVVGTDKAWGQVLLYAAPTISVILGTILYQLQKQAAFYSERLDVRRDRAKIERARKTVERQLAADRISEARRAELVKELEDLDRAELARELADVPWAPKSAVPKGPKTGSP